MITKIFSLKSSVEKDSYIGKLEKEITEMRKEMVESYRDYNQHRPL